MLTCELNGQKINTFDGKFNDEQLRAWSKKKILLCPACGKPYEYCHGRVVRPYFRHMDKDMCEDRYSEAETEEHINGKLDLYEWIKKQPGVTDAELEAWLPGTKQRPDIMFNYYDKPYVIEYQCSSIATEYFERHELYQAAGITDIWICGTEKYLKDGMREKTVGKYALGYYDSTNKKLYLETNEYKILKGRFGRFFSYMCKYDKEIDISTGYYFSKELFARPLSMIKIANNFKIIDSQSELMHSKLKTMNDKREKRLNNSGITRGAKYSGYEYKYIDMLREIRKEHIKYINSKLTSLDNENWEFYPYTSYSMYKTFNYICVVPRINGESISPFDYKLDTIKLWKKSTKELKRMKDMDNLKSVLAEVMESNRNKLIKKYSKNKETRLFWDNGQGE